MPPPRDDTIDFLDTCTNEPDEECLYPSACAPDGCKALCIGNVWLTLCEPCDGVYPECPAAAPAHGSICTADTSGYPCLYEACADNAFAIANCNAGIWDVEHTLCKGPGCLSSEVAEDPWGCPGFSVCMDVPTCTLGHAQNCEPNPCIHEPFSCACAGALCGPFLECVDADAGWITCAARPERLGAPEEIIGEQYGVYNLALGGGYAFWSSSDSIDIFDNYLRRVPVAGGNPQTLSTHYAGVQIIADASNIYILDNAAGVLTKRSWANAVTVLASALSGPADVGVTSQFVLWTENFGGEVNKISLLGGAPQQVASSSMFTFGLEAVDDEYVYYWVGPAAPTVELYRISISSGTPQSLGQVQCCTPSLAVDATHAYWTVQPQGDNSGFVMSMPKTGGQTVALASNQYRPYAIALDDAFVYWTNNEEGTVKRVPKSGGSVELLAKGQLNPSSLAVDDTHVYWANDVNYWAGVHTLCGGIWKVSK